MSPENTKKCPCGRMSKWDEMEFVGLQRLSRFPDIELRNCVCGSTNSKVHLVAVKEDSKCDACSSSIKKSSLSGTSINEKQENIFICYSCAISFTLKP
jgi:hypothetical protein